MHTTVVASLLMVGSLPAVAETITFDQDTAGSVPSGWTAGVTGRGSHHWTVEADAGASSRPQY